MDDPPSAPARKLCCVCDAPGGLHCTKCKSRHYCSKACQLVHWYERGHKAQCRQLAADFQDRMLDALTPEKLKIKEEPAIIEDVTSAAGSRAAPRLPAARTTATAKATALNGDRPSWRGTCAICLDLLPVEADKVIFYPCCCKEICAGCSSKCEEYDTRCPFCRAPHHKSDAEWLRRLQKHVDEGNADAQAQLGDRYRDGLDGLKQSPKRAIQLYALAVAQGHAGAQGALAYCYYVGFGVTINYKTATMWFRCAADQGDAYAQFFLGKMFLKGEGVAQSSAEAVRWYRLAAAQGDADAIYMLGAFYANGVAVPQDLDEALRLYKRAA
eukprot:CAMPEP_0184191044 /NCGR_PEP_ID=MMETSP0976-20121227/2780_1 /TAXON_ID=483370 /ORGANISM="non described non described, Strain CCMP2097" /LENGTH=326 /DNA_ID=CAMNT_0026495443 /DNA_START=83 /DNA_END=1059 /DNA_ORIENTATION=+